MIPACIFWFGSIVSPWAWRGRRRIVQRLDPSLPIADVRTMEEVLGQSYSRQRFSALLLSGFAAVALVLAAIGIYGVVAYSVTARTREFGVRAALGADRPSIVWLVLRTGARPVVLGLLLGVPGAIAASDLLKSLLFGIAPHDPLTFAVVPLFFAALGLAAAMTQVASRGDRAADRKIVLAQRSVNTALSLKHAPTSCGRRFRRLLSGAKNAH